MWPLSEDTIPQATKGNAVHLDATTPTQMWTTKEMEGCGVKELRNTDVEEHEWYEETSTSKAGWRAWFRVMLENCKKAMTPQAQAFAVVREVILCELCSRSFRRDSDKHRHKCVDGRQTVCKQHGAAQCSQCQRRFRSRARLAVYRCMPEV